jgi:hypothetical protein
MQEFYYMNECGVEEIREFSQQVWQVLAPLSPVLVNLYQEDVERALHRLRTLRGEEWMAEALETTTSYPWFRNRGLHDLDGWVQFFKEWKVVLDELYADWSGHKIKILNPHEHWAHAYRQLHLFLQVGQGE